MKSYLFLLLVVFVSLKSSAQLATKYDEQSRKFIYDGFRAVYNFQFDKADSVYEVVAQKFPNDAFPFMISVNNYWWRIISGERTDENVAKCYSEVNKAIDLLKQTDRDDMTNEEIFYVTGFVGYKLRLKILENDLMSAANLGRTHLRYLKTSVKHYDEFIPFYLTGGIYNYLMDYGLDHYPILYPTLIFLPNGDRETGLRLLTLLLKNDDLILKTEAHYFLMRIYIELENDYLTAYKITKSLAEMYPMNLKFQQYYLDNLLNLGKMDEARKLKQQIIKSANSNNSLSEKQRLKFINYAEKALPD